MTLSMAFTTDSGLRRSSRFSLYASWRSSDDYYLKTEESMFTGSGFRSMVGYCAAKVVYIPLILAMFALLWRLFVSFCSDIYGRILSEGPLSGRDGNTIRRTDDDSMDYGSFEISLSSALFLAMDGFTHGARNRTMIVRFVSCRYAYPHLYFLQVDEHPLQRVFGFGPSLSQVDQYQVIFQEISSPFL